MTPQEFFDLFVAELPLYDNSHKINTYYKYARRGPLYGWRKTYFLHRLEFIHTHIVTPPRTDETLVWDVGCGFGTSALFLAMNGIRSIGSTLESYHTIIPQRKKYWRQFGNADLFSFLAEDLFETTYGEGTFDFVLVQDTLHHLEPIDQGIAIIRCALKQNGKLVVVEENGGNIFLRTILYQRRGSNRVMNNYDENLKRTVTMGNENVRPIGQWEKIFHDAGFSISDVGYIKFLPPFVMNENNFRQLNVLEQKLWRKSRMLREGFFWGMNFIAHK